MCPRQLRTRPTHHCLAHTMIWRMVLGRMARLLTPAKHPESSVHSTIRVCLYRLCPLFVILVRITPPYPLPPVPLVTIRDGAALTAPLTPLASGYSQVPVYGKVYHRRRPRPCPERKTCDRCSVWTILSLDWLVGRRLQGARKRAARRLWGVLRIRLCSLLTMI